MNFPLWLLRLTPLGYNINRAFTLDPDGAEKSCIQNLVLLSPMPITERMPLFCVWFDKTYPGQGENLDLIALYQFSPRKLDLFIFSASRSPKKLIRTIWRLGYPDVATRLTQLADLIYCETNENE